MSKSSRTPDLYVVFIDEDEKEFNIFGPIANDRCCFDRTAKLLEEGRNVRCLAADNNDIVTINYYKKKGYKQNDKLFF